MRIRYLLIAIFFSSIGQAQITYQNAFPNLNFAFPTEIQNTGVPNDDRLFVVEQQGRIRVFDNDPNTSSSSTFLNIQNGLYYNSGQELGLLGLAFHPDYDQNGYFYIYYTKRASNFRPIITVERIGVNPSNPNAADLSNRLILFEYTKNQTSTNHNGGKITFGADGYLYISVGDGGGAGDPNENAQNTGNIFGAILRIDVDVDGSNPVDNNGVSPDGNYEIPSDNPLVGQSGRDELYAWGIRNTWKMNFDRQTNRLWAADVGQGDFEEINLIEKGGNYGWSRYEGNQLEDASVPEPSNAIFPIHTYNHNQGDVSITGGYVYRGNQISSTSPSIDGKYIFGDYASGRVWALDYDPATGNATQEFLFRAQDGSGTLNVSTFGEDINNDLYFSDYGSNVSIYKLVDGTTPPSASPISGFGDWCDLPMGTNGTINAIVTNASGQVYVGGNFNTAGGIAANNIAVWDGANWSAVGSGANGSINALAFDSQGNLFAGGSFSQIDGINANNIARWNGISWQALGAGTSGPVAVIEIDANDKVYIGGAFEEVDNFEANNVAVWDNTWSALTDVGTSVAGTGNEVRSIAIDENGTVYIGGNFGAAGGNSVNRIATWNGANWGTLGDGTSGFVQAILATKDYIYAGGNFAIAGGITVNRIARWNRNSLQWESMSNGLSNSVYDIVEYGGLIYVGGVFPNALNNNPDPNIIVNSVTRWSESTSWQALGTSTNVGVDNLINDLHFDGQKLYVGGNFDFAGASSNSASNFSCWMDESICPVGIEISGLSVSGSTQADAFITTADDCNIQSNAIFEAGVSIGLNAGFQVLNGNDFIARIVDCVVSLENLPQEKNIDELTFSNLNPMSSLIIFPNPSTSSTTFEIDLPKAGNVQLAIYDLSGNLIDTPISLQQLPEGIFRLEYGLETYAEGIYFVKLMYEGNVTTEKLFLLGK